MLYMNIFQICTLIFTSINRVSNADNIIHYQNNNYYYQTIPFVPLSNINVSSDLRYFGQPNGGCRYGFNCNSGECISICFLCDGVPHCEDASDESAIICQSMTCPKSTYTCAYGACVNKDAHCNAVVECMDGSDEIGCSTPTEPTRRTESTTVTSWTESTTVPSRTESTTVSSPILTPSLTTMSTSTSRASGMCILESPSNGQYNEYPTSGWVISGWVIMVRCKKGYIADVRSAICLQGKWSPKLPKCVRTCESLYSHNATTFKCMLNGKELASCDNPMEGTYVEIICRDYYEASVPQFTNILQCQNGSWGYNATNYCKPKCGRKTLHDISSLINGTDDEVGIYPWQVDIYRHEEHICGGAVLSPRVVISAAHCFTHLSNGNLLPRENYIVAAGKYYRDYDHPSDTFAQYSLLWHIEIPGTYKGRINMFEGDLALLILTTPFYLSERVQPVCVDWLNSFEYTQLKLGNFGIVTGWRQTAEGNSSSETLKELEIPYIHYSLCYNQLPKNLKPFIRHDMICGGYLEKGKSICGLGNSGGALSFKNKDDDRYYIRAVVSLSPTQELGQCDSNRYSIFTLTSTYISTISKILHDYP